MATVERHRTAISRTFVSRPVSLALEDNVLEAGMTFFDYGCGRGDDVQKLQEVGYEASGWDPSFAPAAPKKPADVVNLGYVVNVIESPPERALALREAWTLARRVLVVAARPEWERRDLVGAVPHGDGVLTASGTFQKFYRQDELRSWIQSNLGESPIAGSLGIFYVFRDGEILQRFLALQARRETVRPGMRVSDLLFERFRSPLESLIDFLEKERRLPAPGEVEVEDQLASGLGSLRAAFHLIRRVTGSDRWGDIELPQRIRQSERRFYRYRELLEPLLNFMEERGRLPRENEIHNWADLLEEFRSVGRAFSLLRTVIGAEHWAEARKRSQENFLVYLALAAFNGRSKLKELPDDLRYDVRDLFGTYTNAKKKADELLFAAGNSDAVTTACVSAPVGKLTPEALYVHVSALGTLPPLLRVYEGCGRALTGAVEGTTIVKLHRLKAQVSYLQYPAFDRDPHPTLSSVVIARLARLDISFKDFRDSENPPLLHRKEVFVGPSYPGRERFRRLTVLEEKWGLLEDPTTIGTALGWARRLRESGSHLQGHRLVRTRTEKGTTST